jgi:hypothetical protein
MEYNLHGERPRMPEPNAKPKHNSRNHTDTYPNADVCAGYHGVEYADDYSAQFGLVQQRHRPHRQQLLESV